MLKQYRLIDCLIDLLLIDWSIDRLIDWLNNWLIGWLIDWLINWLVDLKVTCDNSSMACSTRYWHNFDLKQTIYKRWKLIGIIVSMPKLTAFILTKGKQLPIWGNHCRRQVTSDNIENASTRMFMNKDHFGLIKQPASCYKLKRNEEEWKGIKRNQEESRVMKSNQEESRVMKRNQEKSRVIKRNQEK